MIIIDCLVIGLLLVSACINIVALGAFWVTPSLRTTANRFVVNLLAANLVCCIILGPSLLVSEITTPVSEFDPEFNQTESKLKYTLTEIRCWGLDFAGIYHLLNLPFKIFNHVFTVLWKLCYLFSIILFCLVILETWESFLVKNKVQFEDGLFESYRNPRGHHKKITFQ